MDDDDPRLASQFVWNRRVVILNSALPLRSGAAEDLRDPGKRCAPRVPVHLGHNARRSPTPRERADFRTTTGSRNECGFDDYAVWGWDQKSVPSVPMFLSHKAYLVRRVKLTSRWATRRPARSALSGLRAPGRPFRLWRLPRCERLLGWAPARRWSGYPYR